MTPEPPAAPEEPLLDHLDEFTTPGSILRSWFWRYYDHLVSLVLLNVLWFTGCILPLWAWGRWAHPMAWAAQAAGLLVFFLWATSLSLGVAYAVFLLFNEGRADLAQVWKGFRHFGARAAVLGAGLFLFSALAVLNIRFYWQAGGFHGWVGWGLGILVAWVLLVALLCALYHWPLLFFQDAPLLKTLRRSLWLALAQPATLAAFAILVLLLAYLFTLVPAAWILLGFTFFFSLDCMLLEKQMLKYKIVYQDRALDDLLAYLSAEKKRGLKELIKPWEHG